jgi:hypothetical protein
MLVEAVAAALVGLAVLWLVLQPLISPRPRAPLPLEPLDPEETPKGVALTALREIEFDRETGKLSDPDYHPSRRNTPRPLSRLFERSQWARVGCPTTWRP